jgi:signal transduction histidine kinase
MRLSIAAKLMMVGLVVLALPILGFRYLEQMRGFLLEGQIQAQSLAARALAGTLAGHAELQWQGPTDGTGTLYVHRLPGHVEVDGYGLDWDHAAEGLRPFPGAEQGLSLVLGARERRLYVLFDVVDGTRNYRRPGDGRSDNGDGLRLLIQERTGEVRRFLVIPEGPGISPAQGADPQWRPTAAVSARSAGWQERPGGYRVELELADTDVVRIGVGVLDRKPGHVTARLRAPGDSLVPILGRWADIEARLGGMGSVSSGAWVVDRSGWVRASLPQENGRRGAWQRVDRQTGAAVASGQHQVQRHPGDFGAAERVQVVEPLIDSGQVLGAVILEREMGPILDLQWDAFLAIAHDSVVYLLLVVIALLLFAWRLAWRIRRLGAETDAAIDADGRVRAAALTTAVRATDEIGALARRVSGMLGRLARYTAFLERMPHTLRHEINNPLNVIVTSLHNIREQYPEAAESGYLQSAERASRRLGLIVSEMTEAASLEQSLRREAHSEVDLARLVASYAEGCQALHPDRRVGFRGPVAGVTVQGNDLRIEQLLDKLMDNALEFTPSGGKIELSVDRLGAEALLEVENEGPPLPSDPDPGAVQSLVSARAAGGQGRPHLGMGLFVARIITEFHGGALTASNRTDGTGVVIRARFPLSRHP